MQLAAPATLYCPGRQKLVQVDVVKPLPVPYSPAGHSLHVDAPNTSLYWPGAHCVCAASPEDGTYAPVDADVQAVDPVDAANCPAGQYVHQSTDCASVSVE